MCYLIRCYLAWPHEQGHWPASAWAHYKPSPFLSPFSSLPPTPLLPMNVSISLPMCKLFSPALRADGEQCLCRDFLCMSFLISQRVTRFPCSLLEKGKLAPTCTHTLHTMHTHATHNLPSICTLCHRDIDAVVAVTGFIT